MCVYCMCCIYIYCIFCYFQTPDFEVQCQAYLESPYDEMIAAHIRYIPLYLYTKYRTMCCRSSILSNKSFAVVVNNIIVTVQRLGSRVNVIFECCHSAVEAENSALSCGLKQISHSASFVLY